MLKMKLQTRQPSTTDRRLAGNKQVRREIESFLHALQSYPEIFAQDPRITFEKHHGGLVQAASGAARRRV